MIPEKKEIASEAGHWYTKTGEPCYTIVGGNGKERPVTLRDAKRLDLVPSVTTILQIYPKPALIKWMQKQVLMSALTLTRAENESDEDFMARIGADAQQQAENARNKGTAIHGAIERYLIGEKEKEPKYLDYAITGCIALSVFLDNADIFANCEPEKSFASEMGYGGKVDLHSRELNFVCDFKTKEFNENTGKLGYLEHQIQLSAYAHGLGMPDARLINVFISTTIPGLARIVEYPKDAQTFEIFKKCLELWRLIKKV